MLWTDREGVPGIAQSPECTKDQLPIRATQRRQWCRGQRQRLIPPAGKLREEHMLHLYKGCGSEVKGQLAMWSNFPGPPRSVDAKVSGHHLDQKYGVSNAEMRSRVAEAALRETGDARLIGSAQLKCPSSLVAGQLRGGPRWRVQGVGKTHGRGPTCDINKRESGGGSLGRGPTSVGAKVA